MDLSLSDRSAVHVWQLRLDLLQLPKLAQCLSRDELDRASRFKFANDRSHFESCRGALRTLVGAYLGQPAQDVKFAYGNNGKPRVESSSWLHFNVAHSGNLALLAFADNLELGVDVERIRELKEMDGIIDGFFSPDERSDLLSLPVTERVAAFYRCWTRKEALTKATGEGLSAALDKFRVTFGEADTPRIVYINHSPAEASRWTLHNLTPHPNYAAAVAYRSPPRKLRLFEFTPQALYSLERLA